MTNQERDRPAEEERRLPAEGEDAAPAPETAGGAAAAPRGKKGRRIAVVLILLAALAGLGLFGLQKWRAAGGGAAGIKETLISIAGADELVDRAKALKASLKRLAAALKKQDTEKAQAERAALRQAVAELRAELDEPRWKKAALVPGVGGEIRASGELLTLLEQADDELLGPCLEQLERDPVSSLRAEGGLRVEPVLRYMDLLEELLPKAQALFARLEAVDLGLLDSSGEMKKTLEELEPVLALGEELRERLPALRAILGDGSDRLYLFAAQNSAEIRASGGFPGSVGLVRIRDGVLTVTDFQSVYNVLAPTTAADMHISEVERKIFGGRMLESWDSDFSPDFERVASIWARAYQDRNHETLDGVISATQAVIPRLLSILGDITLSDGTELNGENAGRVLGHDLYFKYFSKPQKSGANRIVDDLFAECAKKTMDLLLSELEADKLPACWAFFRESFADRTLMVWMADEAEEQLMREAGWSASLNTDPEKPEIGVFFNSTVSSKMGWFLEIETSLSDPVREEDGSVSRLLTVRLDNIMTQEERLSAGTYIRGGTLGVTGFFYVFAPAGGRIVSMEADNGWKAQSAVYEGLDLSYLAYMTVYDRTPVTVTCRVAAAPGVETEPVLVVTPTMQEYH